MRYMILSDIHGCATTLKKALSLFETEKYDALLLLGDILYHGPRNSVPDGYNPSEVVSLLNHYSDKIFACRGNCEAEVDQMLLNFPCLSDYVWMVNNKTKCFATHGHLYNEENLPKISGTSIFFYGHTHIWTLKSQDNLIICNPGSITLPKQNNPQTFAHYIDNEISIFTLDGKCLATKRL